MIDHFLAMHNRICADQLCEKRVMPFSNYCHNHIMNDEDQQMYDIRMIEGESSSETSPNVISLGCSIEGCARPPLSQRIIQRLVGPPPAFSQQAKPVSLCCNHAQDLLAFARKTKRYVDPENQLPSQSLTSLQSQV
ncbi:MAG: hypothetical protein EZS28_035236 [Streblomastix strix]|uniref:KANL2-like probable zinc-finger domain-containing protein n=1 Tax=Streblomastix strix TaxID=222440 RepID=A0A5J4UF23_9EUKA|nr:MAG: hypothetical protein EZS28_035236 [Streblomastix strix]